MTQAERHHGADLAKWIGLALMVLDHAWNAIPAEWQSIYGYVRVPGRLAFPIFCAVIAINVARSAPGDLGALKRNLVGLLWFEALSVATLGLSWGEPRLTVLTTLAGGLVIAAAIHHGTLMLRVAACVILLAGFAANLRENVFDYGFWGLLMPSAFMQFFRSRAWGSGDAWMAWMAGLMMLLPLANYGLGQILVAFVTGLPDGYKGKAAEFGKNRTLSRLGLSAFPVPLLPIRGFGEQWNQNPTWPAANVRLKYALTGRQAGTLGNVRIGPIPAFSDASPATSRAST